MVSVGKSTRSRCHLWENEGLVPETGNHWAGSYNPHLAAMLESIDDGVGMIMEKLDQPGLADNTIIVFTSDNGGEAPNVTSNAPLRGCKSQLYEGGIRVPLIVRWKGKVPAGTVSSLPTANVDFYPTFMDATQTTPDPRPQLDGISILPVLRNPGARLERDTLYWHDPLEKPRFLGGRSSGAIRNAGRCPTRPRGLWDRL